VVDAPDAYVPERGDAVWINLQPRAGHEQAGRRGYKELWKRRVSRDLAGNTAKSAHGP
jgi:hypothetical protein